MDLLLIDAKIDSLIILIEKYKDRANSWVNCTKICYLFICLFLFSNSLKQGIAQSFPTTTSLPYNLGVGTNYTACGTPGTKVLDIPVSGLSNLNTTTNALTLVKIEFNQFAPNANFYLKNLKGYLQAPDGTCITVFDGTTASLSPYVNLTGVGMGSSTLSCARTLNSTNLSTTGTTNNAINQSGNGGYFKTATNYETALDGKDPNGVWKLYWSSSNNPPPGIVSLELQFGIPTYSDETANGENCVSAIIYDGTSMCVQTGGKTPSANLPGSTTGIGSSNNSVFNNGTCAWNGANNNDVWVQITAPDNNPICMSVSGVSSLQQSIVVTDPNLDGDNNPCTGAGFGQYWDIVSCPNNAPLIYSGTSGTQRNQTHCWTPVAGQVYYLVVDGNGGAESAFFINGNITTDCVPPIVTTNPHDSSVCVGVNAAFSVSSGGTAPLTFQWELSTDGGVVYNPILAAGANPVYSNWTTASLGITNIGIGNNNYKYRVIVTNACGSDTSNIANLAVYNSPIVNITNITGNDTLTCSRTSISVTAIPAGATSYLWSGGATTGTANNSFTSPGTYTVTVTGTGGCTGTSSITIRQNNTPPVVGITNITGNDTLTCSRTSISVTATPAGATSYLWSGGATTGTANNSFTSPGTYTVTVTGTGGCTGTSGITIRQNNTPPVVGITNITGNDTLTCSRTSISVTATPAGATSYLWSGGATTGTANNSFTNPGTYTVTVTGTGGCTGTSSITIRQNNTPPVVGITNITGNDTLTCSRTSISVTATPAGATSYLWSGGATTGTANNSFTSPGTYTVTVTGSNGCTSTSSITITRNITPPSVGITNTSGGTIIDCVTTKIDVTATGGGTYLWSGGVSVNTAANSFTAPGVYTVTVTGLNGCTATSSITITSAPPINVLVTDLENDHCQQGVGSVTVTVPNVSGIITYTWLMSPHISGNSLNGLKAGTYQVVASNGTCADTLSVTIIDTPGPTAAFQPSPSSVNLNTSISFINQSVGGDDYQWSFGDGATSTDFSPSHSYSSAMMYEVYLQVVDAFGCTDSVMHYVTIIDDINIYIPNTFTPNADGINDVFRPYGTGYDENDYEMTIYDRWGGLVFSSSKFDIGWDGKDDGLQLDINNVFVYRIVVYDLIGKKHVYIGHVTMIGSKVY